MVAHRHVVLLQRFVFPLNLIIHNFTGLEPMYAVCMFVDDVVYPYVTMEKAVHNRKQGVTKEQGARLSKHITMREIQLSRILIALSFSNPKPRPSALVARNPGSTTSEIAAAPSNLRNRGETMKGKVVRMARVSVTRKVPTHSRLH